MKKTQEVHILIGCADARDLNQSQVEAVAAGIRRYAQNGIEIDFHVIRAAGSFVTPDVYMDVKRTIEHSLRATSAKYEHTSYYIHIQTHGHLDETSNKNYVSHIYEMNIVPNSPLNCGMLGATGVGVEIEQLLIEEKLTASVHGKTIIVDADHKIRDLLKEVYAYDGYLAGDWIKSIDYLRTHPRSQRAILEKLIDNDADLHCLDIKVTAGILDYSIHALIRLDDGEPKVPFWDEVQLDIRERAKNMKAVLEKQSEKQKAACRLNSMADPEMASRVLAAKYYLDMKGIDSEQYIPNTVLILQERLLIFHIRLLVLM